MGEGGGASGGGVKTNLDCGTSWGTFGVFFFFFLFFFFFFVCVCVFVCFFQTSCHIDFPALYHIFENW